MSEATIKRDSRTDWPRVRTMKDEDIDFSDIPELTGDEGFFVGKFYRPIKLVTVRKVPIKMSEASNILSFVPQ